MRCGFLGGPCCRGNSSSGRGKPGLAVTLCQLCWRNGTEALFTGEALAKDVRLSLENSGGANAAELLAHFALAGKAGLTVDAVALATGIPAIQLRRQVEVLSMAGVLEVAEKSRLTVTPLRLGQALVRDIFAGHQRWIGRNSPAKFQARQTSWKPCLGCPARRRN